ncbi:MAG: O-antigen ligase family protein [Candidatus Dormibacteria bacterium]
MPVTRALTRLSATLAFAYVLRAKILGIPTTALELFLLATIGAYVVEKLRAGEGFPDPRRLPYFWPLALLLVAATISVVVAPGRQAAAGIWKAYFIEPVLIAYVLADSLRAREHIEKVVAAFFYGAIVVAMLNTLTFLYAVGVHAPNLVEQPPVVIYFTPNATGLFLGPLMAIAAALILFGSSRERTRGVIFWVIALPAFALSFSRGAWLALSVAMVLLAWHHPLRVRLLSLLGVALMASLALPPVRRRLAHEFNPQDKYNSVNLRQDLYQATFQMMKSGKHPLFGTGLSGFKHDIAPFKDTSNYREDLIYPHNVFLDFYTETGLLGLVAFTWLAIDWARRTYRTLQLRTPLRPYYLGLAAASVTILVHGMLDVPFFKNDLAFMTMAFVGLQVAASRLDGQA